MSDQDADDTTREWNEAERLQLMALTDIGVPLKFIARALRRERTDIISQAWQMGLTLTREDKE